MKKRNMRRCLFILGVIISGAVQAAPPTMEEIRPYLDEIKAVTQAQQPFYMFPDEENGHYEYRFIRPLDCAEFSYRDSLGLRKTNGFFSFFRATRLLSLYDAEFVEMEESHPTGANYEHYTVNIGARVKEIARLVYVEMEDERGIRKLPDSSVPVLVLRYQNRQSAERVYLAMQKLVQLCQGER